MSPSHPASYERQTMSIRRVALLTANDSAGRSDGFLKWKSHFDEECTVVAHHPGKGKYTGLLGAVTCENRHGRFRIGSGWKDSDRRNPPAIGAVITYRYRGFTAKGLPRFATYLRRFQEN